MENNPYSSLNPNTTYYGPHQAEYHTDNYGRVASWYGQSVDDKEPRNFYAQRTLEGKNPEHSHAGHMLAVSQGGSGERFNMTAQNASVNCRDYRAFERENAALVQQGYTVELYGENTFFPGGVNVPDAYLVERDVSLNGEVVDVQHFSWSNADMSLYETEGQEEVAALQQQFENPGAYVYNEDMEIAVNYETGAVVDLNDGMEEPGIQELNTGPEQEVAEETFTEAEGVAETDQLEL